jgi:hypothetical protein
MMGNPEIGGATPVRRLIGSKDAINHEAEVAPRISQIGSHDETAAG